MRLVELLPEIDDIDGTPMKTQYNIIFGGSSGNGNAKTGEEEVK